MIIKAARSARRCAARTLATVASAGEYRVRFDTQIYFMSHGAAAFYPRVEVMFLASGPEHYHIPLLLSPFGYTTYRGS